MSDKLLTTSIAQSFLLLVAFGVANAADGDPKSPAKTVVNSPDGRNSIAVDATDKYQRQLRFTITRDGKTLIGPSPLGPKLVAGGVVGDHSRVLDVKRSKVDESFELPWGKTKTVTDRCSVAIIELKSDNHLQWSLELRAYDDGLAFRYRLPKQEKVAEVEVEDEATQFGVAGNAMAIFNNLKSFKTSHEALYSRKPVADIPCNQLMDMPLLLVWSNNMAAAITEARVRNFAGMYLERTSPDRNSLECRLSPSTTKKGVSVAGKLPIESPWRVVLIGDSAGKLLESNLLLCLNDPPHWDFSWALPGKTSFHWWNGEFEDDYKVPNEQEVFVNRHKRYIDFCAENHIAYHAVSGDGLAWYPQSSKSYATPGADADVRVARPELELPEIIAYGREKGVGIRLWVHWKPLSEHLEQAFTNYESWGVKGLMVDFLDRDDQEMIDFEDRLLESAARHKLHIQIHGSSKYSGEQRTFPNLFNREGVLNLEYLKWSDLCTPQHEVDVAYTRALAGPVDFHLGGFRSVSRANFHPQDRDPVVMGTRCHNMALYVVYENPMPMVADTPAAYEGQAGFEFIRDVPTTWDETRFVAGEPGEFIVLARRSGNDWYLGGITNWTARELDLPLQFLPAGEFTATLYGDGSMDEAKPNSVAKSQSDVSQAGKLHCALASGGGFVAVLRPK